MHNLPHDRFTVFDAVLFVVLVILCFVVYSTSETGVQADTEQTAHTWFHEARWLGYSTDTNPCTFGADVYADDYPIELTEAVNNRYEYLIINWEDDTFTQIFTEDVIDYGLTWRTFERGADGHPHPVSALEAYCDFDKSVPIPTLNTE